MQYTGQLTLVLVPHKTLGLMLYLLHNYLGVYIHTNSLAFLHMVCTPTHTHNGYNVHVCTQVNNHSKLVHVWGAL